MLLVFVVVALTIGHLSRCSSVPFKMGLCSARMREMRENQHKHIKGEENGKNAENVKEANRRENGNERNCRLRRRTGTDSSRIIIEQTTSRLTLLIAMQLRCSRCQRWRSKIASCELVCVCVSRFLLQPEDIGQPLTFHLLTRNTPQPLIFCNEFPKNTISQLCAPRTPGTPVPQIKNSKSFLACQRTVIL